MRTAARAPDGRLRLQLVVASACHSAEVAGAFLASGVRHLVAVEHEARIADVAARKFAHAFYLSLFVGRTVRDAFNAARTAVAHLPAGGWGISGETEYRKFCLLPADGNHDVSLFPALPRARARELPGLAAELTARRPVSYPEHFVGRHVELWMLLQRVLRGRLVVLTGPRGVGKSALAMALAHYVADRSRSSFDRAELSDGVVWCQLAAVKTASGCAAALRAAIDVCWGPLPENATSFYQNPTDRLDGRSGGVRTPARTLTRRDSSIATAAQVEAALLSRLAPAQSLLILDGCEYLLAAEPADTLALLALIAERAPDVRILITAADAPRASPAGGDGGQLRFSVPHVAERVFALGPLEPHHAAVLLYRLARDLGRVISAAELGVPHGANRNAVWPLLASHPTVLALGGNPGRIAEAALELQGQPLGALFEARAPAPVPVEAPADGGVAGGNAPAPAGAEATVAAVANLGDRDGGDAAAAAGGRVGRREGPPSADAELLLHL
ncbi:hypothetical protein T492DRAFT_400028 [Pavlovales sp. CCMP2436]|nr:hypothetical protein T492DRAFT_400028 [Pavlovales sp. CCMP2436]